MVLRRRVLDLVEDVGGLSGTLLGIAEREVETVTPQWTHFQHAQLSTLHTHNIRSTDVSGLLAREVTLPRRASG